MLRRLRRPTRACPAYTCAATAPWSRQSQLCLILHQFRTTVISGDVPGTCCCGGASVRSLRLVMLVNPDLNASRPEQVERGLLVFGGRQRRVMPQRRKKWEALWPLRGVQRSLRLESCDLCGSRSQRGCMQRSHAAAGRVYQLMQHHRAHWMLCFLTSKNAPSQWLPIQENGPGHGSGWVPITAAYLAGGCNGASEGRGVGAAGAVRPAAGAPRPVRDAAAASALTARASEGGALGRTSAAATEACAMESGGGLGGGGFEATK